MKLVEIKNIGNFLKKGEQMSMLKVLSEYADAILELIYPTNMEEFQDLPFISAHQCTLCSRELRMIEDGPLCKDCSGKNLYFDKVISVVKYDQNIKKLIYKYKYSGHTYLGRTMGELMGKKFLTETNREYIIIPVPLYKSKEIERGFNQSYLLAKYVGRETSIPLEKDSLIRVKNTKVMHSLSKKEREENVENAFKVAHSGVIKDKNIILVDDIFTTGSTVNACSKILKQSGAKSVIILTFARD